MIFKELLFFRSVRYYYLKFIRIRAEDVDVARGMALGVFIGLTPTMGIQIPIALACSFLFRTNRIAPLVGVFVSNPLTAIPIYSFNFKLGKLVIGSENMKMAHFDSFMEIIKLGREFLMTLWFGSFIVAIIGAGIAYLVTIRVYPKIRLKRFVKAREENSPTP